MKTARAVASTNDEKLLFSKEACLPFHLIAMSHFKERTRLDQQCPVSISFEFKGSVSIWYFMCSVLKYCFTAVYVLFIPIYVSWVFYFLKNKQKNRLVSYYFFPPTNFSQKIQANS